MSLETKKKLHQYALWFDHNRRQLSDPQQTTKFAIKALDQIADVLAHLYRDVYDLERRNESTTSTVDAGIWLPTHLRHEEAVRRQQEQTDGGLFN